MQYRNPAVGVAAILHEADLERLLGRDALDSALSPPARPATAATDRYARVLLGRRARNPAGTWCIPCGYLEVDEDVREGLEREVLEETGLVIEVGSVYRVHSNFHDPDRQSVGIWFETFPVGGCLRPGDDLDALMLVDPASPGVPLAFPTDALVLADLAARYRLP